MTDMSPFINSLYFVLKLVFPTLKAKKCLESIFISPSIVDTGCIEIRILFETDFDINVILGSSSHSSLFEQQSLVQSSKCIGAI